MTDLLERLAAALADRYTVQREIGAGGMAVVYLAHDQKLSRQVALKVLRPELAASLGSERFLREIEIAAKLTHPNILGLYDCGDAGGRLYYTMPFVEGETLRDRLVREKQLPVDDALAITKEVADALGHAHSLGIVHRDIKPENILFAAGHALVSDFGIARAVTAAGGETRTETGLAVGTPAYMSPEQATGTKDIDARTDLYSLGCVLYEMLTGETPFSAPTPMAVIAKKLSEPLPRVSVVRDAVPVGMERALTKALAKTPADRYRTAEEFVTALESGAAVPGTAGGLRRRRLLRWVAAVVIPVVAVGAMAMGLWFTRQPKTTGDEAISPYHVAVLPFAVRGAEDLAYLSEGMVDLLSTQLDGAGELTTVDPHALLGFVRRGAVGVDTEGGARVAQEFGAGLYLLGSVVGAGGEALVSVTLYDRDDAAVAQAQGRLEDEAQLLLLVDDLARQLLATGVGGPGTRPSELAQVTTPSLPALKAYLRGENARRRGQLDSAVAAWEEAVAADTTFALASLRLASVPAGLTTADQGEAIERALRHADRLSERDRALTEVRAAEMRGAWSEAERRLRALVERYPDDVEGWLEYGSRLMQPVVVSPRPLSEARGALERVLELDPDHTGALYLLSWLAGWEEKHDESAALLERLLELQPEGDLAVVDRMALAYAHGDRAEQERLLTELRGRCCTTQGAYRVWYAAMEVLRASGDTRGAIEVVHLLTEPGWSFVGQAFGYFVAAHLYLSVGQWRAAKAELDRYEALGGVTPGFSALTTRAILAALPFVPEPDSELEDLRSRLTSLERSGPSSVAYPFLAGLLSARLDDPEAAERYAAEVEAYGAAPPPDSEWKPSIFEGGGVTPEQWVVLTRDLALQVRAAASWSEGRAAEALALLDGTDREQWQMLAGTTASTWHTHVNYLRAELLREIGREEEALLFYERFGRMPRTRIYVALAHYRRAEIFERRGDVEAAARHYRRMTELWADCDPELRPMVEQVREHLAQLE